LSNITRVPITDTAPALAYPAVAVIVTAAGEVPGGPSTHLLLSFLLEDGEMSEAYSVHRGRIADLCETIVRAVESMEARDRTL
jgi:hypothetical protein